MRQSAATTRCNPNLGFRIYKEPISKAENREPIYNEQAVPGAGGHFKNFLDCIQSRQEPNCPVELSAQAVSGPHLANVAYHNRCQGRLGADGKVSLG